MKTESLIHSCEKITAVRCINRRISFQAVQIYTITLDRFDMRLWFVSVLAVGYLHLSTPKLLCPVWLVMTAKAVGFRVLTLNYHRQTSLGLTIARQRQPRRKRD
jgi:hypothetical protein